MSYIRVRKTLATDPRLAQIASLVGLSADETLGVLVRLWCWATDHAPRGVAPITTTQLDKMAGHDGFAGVVEVGWLEARLHEICFANWCDYSRTPRRSKLQKLDAEAAGARPVVLPSTLDTAGFRAAWQEWLEHRRALGKPLTLLAISRQLLVLQRLGLRRAIAAIEHSILRNWKGIYEPGGSSQRVNAEQTQQKQQQEDDQLAVLIKEQARAAEQQRQDEERLHRERQSEPMGSLLFGRHDHGGGEGQPQRGGAPS